MKISSSTNVAGARAPDEASGASLPPRAARSQGLARRRGRGRGRMRLWARNRLQVQRQDLSGRRDLDGDGRMQRVLVFGGLLDGRMLCRGL
jgi:hypothetical protein